VDPREPFAATGDGSLTVGLGSEERRAIRDLVGGYRDLLENESQATDAAVARLFPPAYKDDPLRNFDFDRQTHDPLLRSRLEAISTIETTADVETLSTEQARQWLGVLNDLRLVLGTRLDVTEDEDGSGFQDDPETADAFALYRWLTGLLGGLLEAIDPGISDVEAAPPPADGG
jgi:uncharacterized protein DUF2017